MPLRHVVTALLLTAAAGVAASADDVDPKHLALADCPAQPGCPAVVLLDECELDNSSTRSRYSVHRLVKVFTKEGVDRWSDVEAPTAVGGFSVRNLEGRTVLPDGRSIPLTQDNVFVKYLRMGKRHAKRKTAKFPGVVPGAIIDYSYDVLTEPNNILTQVAWDIQQEIPVLESRFLLKSGKYVLEWKKAGGEAIQVKEERLKPPTNIRFTAGSIPPLIREPYGLPVEAARFRYHFNLPELNTSWLPAFVGRVAGRSGAFIDNPEGVAGKVAELVAPADPPIEKVRKIYRFVQEKVGTEEMRAGATEEKALEEAKDAGEVLRRGFGNEFERTMLFLSMVKAAGLEHGLLLIAGRFSSALVPEVDDEEQFDSFATAVRTGAGWTFYDPATRHCPFGMLSPEKEGGKTRNAILVTPAPGAGAPREALVQKLRVRTWTPSNFAFASIPFSAAGKSVLKREITATHLAEGGMEVAVTQQGTGLVDLDHKQDYELLDEADRKDTLRGELEERLTSVELVSAAFQDLDSFDKPAVLTYTFRLPGETAPADRLVVTPSIFHAGEPMPFAPETRRTNVLFRHARKTQETIRYVPPQGFEVEEMPAPVVVKDPPLSLVIAYSLDAGALVITRNLEVDAAEWPATDYARLRSFFEKVQEADRQVVTVRRRAS